MSEHDNSLYEALVAAEQDDRACCTLCIAWRPKRRLRRFRHWLWVCVCGQPWRTEKGPLRESHLAVEEVDPMSGRITSNPKRQHHCNAGWRVETDEEAAVREAKPEGEWSMHLPEGSRLMIEDFPWAAAGTIWTCDDCGLEWKATYPYPNVFAPTWVRHRPLRPLRPIRWPWKRSKEDA